MSAMALNLAAVDLMAICGNIDTPGGWLLVHNAFNVSRGSDDGVKWVDPEAAKKKATMHYVFNTDGEDFIHQAASEAVLHCMETGEPYPIKMWYAQSTNELPACAAMDAPRLYKALKENPLHRVCRSVPDAHGRGAGRRGHARGRHACERNSARSWWTPVRTLSKVTSYYEAKSDEEIIVALGRRLNPDAFPWDTAEDFVNWFLTPQSGLASFGTKASANNQLDQQRYSQEFPFAGDLEGLQKARRGFTPTTSSTPAPHPQAREGHAAPRRPTGLRDADRPHRGFRRSPSRCGASRRGRTSRSPRRGL